MPKKKSVIKKFRLGLFAAMFVLLLLSVVACASEEAKVLSFKTIEQQDTARTGILYEERQPGIMIIAEESDVGQLAGLVTTRAQRRLEQLDYDSVFAVVVFQGFKGSNRYGAEIRQVVRQGNTVLIVTNFTEPTPELEVADEETSPYHVVTVSKGGQWGQKIDFDLEVDGKQLAEESKFIP